MKINGTIKTVFNIKINATSIQRREFVLQTDEKYPQLLIMEFIGDACNILDSFVKGDKVIVHFSLKGIEWINPEGKKVYFKFIRANKIQKIVSDFENFEKLNLSHFLLDLNKDLN